MGFKNTLLIITCLFIILLGCGKTTRVYLRTDTRISRLEQVAILPFDNISGEADAGEKVRNVFLTGLYNLGVLGVVESGEVERFLLEERLRSTAQLNTEIIQKMGKKLKVDGIILGAVQEYKYTRIGNEDVPVVSISIRIVDTGTGSIIMAVTHSRAGNDREKVFGLGRIRTLSQMTDIVIDELLNSLAVKLPPRYAMRKKIITETTKPSKPSEETVKIPEELEKVEEEKKKEEAVPVEKSADELKEESRKLSKEYFEKIKAERGVTEK